MPSLLRQGTWSFHLENSTKFMFTNDPLICDSRPKHLDFRSSVLQLQPN
jgi:hypothetical protein